MIVDLPLVRRVEHAAAQECVVQAEAVEGSRWEWVDSGALIGMGPGRYVNRAFGIGLGDTPQDALVDTVESFYAEVGMPAKVELCPWVSAEVLAAFARRGHATTDFTSVFARELDDLPAPPEVAIEPVTAATVAEWTAVHGARSPEGSPERATSDEFCAAMRRVPGSFDFLVRNGAVAVAAASFTLLGDIAWFGGAGTVTTHRGTGLQAALIADRLHRARGLGSQLAVATAVPSGPSARNLLRAGFQLLYTRTVLARG